MSKRKVGDTDLVDELPNQRRNMATEQVSSVSSQICNISSELLHHLLCFLDARDLGRLSQTSTYFRDFIIRDELLWRKLYIRKFDEPNQTPQWSEVLKTLTQLEATLRSTNHGMKQSQSLDIFQTAIPLLLSPANPKSTKNQEFMASLFTHDSRLSNINLLRQSSLFHKCGLPYDEPADTFQLRQLSAKMHVFYGMIAEVRESELLDIDGAREIHPAARARVYDLRRYKAKNHWGPFMDDGSGRIDWEKVQSIFVVLGHGLRMLTEKSHGRLGPYWDSPFEGLATNSYRPLISEKREDEDNALRAAARRHVLLQFGHSDISQTQPREDIPGYISPRQAQIAAFEAKQEEFTRQDPYGVKGTWMRIVNFLDYNDLYAFNFESQTVRAAGDREPLNTQEAFRLILLKLWVTKIEWPTDEKDESRVADVPGSSSKGKSRVADVPGSSSKGKSRSKKWPIVHFAGRSQSLHIRWDPNANSAIRGSNPLYNITGYVRAYYAPSPSADEYKPDPEPNLNHVYPNHTVEEPQSDEPATPSEPPTASPSSSWSTVNSRAPSEPDRIIPEPAETEMEEDDENLVVRWTTFSVFHGEERWRSEGVQIGGPKSGRGILGNWFDKDYDFHGPAGPTGFWKLGDGESWIGSQAMLDEEPGLHDHMA